MQEMELVLMRGSGCRGAFIILTSRGLASELLRITSSDTQNT